MTRRSGDLGPQLRTATVADNMRHASTSTTHFYLHADEETPAALSDGIMSRLAARKPRAERHLQVVQGA